MPLTISSDAIAEKNKLAQSSPWLSALLIQYPSQSPIRIVWNTENITWNGETWNAASFILGDIDEEKEGNSNTTDLTIVDISRTISPLLDLYDGGVGATVTAYILHADHLDNAEPELEVDFYILKTTVDYMNRITFRLGGENLSKTRSPQDRYLKGHCRYQEFKGTLCGYSGGETECNRTFAQCRSYGNQVQFGGFPGVGSMGYFR